LLVIVGGSYAMYRYIKNPSSKKESFGYRLWIKKIFLKKIIWKKKFLKKDNLEKKNF
jgi:hypothetical protein